MQWLFTTLILKPLFQIDWNMATIEGAAFNQVNICNSFRSIMASGHCSQSTELLYSVLQMCIMCADINIMNSVLVSPSQISSVMNAQGYNVACRFSCMHSWCKNLCKIIFSTIHQSTCIKSPTNSKHSSWTMVTIVWQCNVAMIKISLHHWCDCNFLYEILYEQHQWYHRCRYASFLHLI